MRVISKSRLRAFWEAPHQGDAKGPLEAWYAHVNDRDTQWHDWRNLKAEIGTADQVGDCVVFNIGGNKYRLIARVRYPTQKVYVLKVMTHKEYDKKKWIKECGCYDPPPRKSA